MKNLILPISIIVVGLIIAGAVIYTKSPQIKVFNITPFNQKAGIGRVFPSISESSKIGHYPAPDFNLKDIEGNEVSLGSLKSNNLLLVFWTTWCGWCTKEKPILKEFVNDYQDKIKVIGINIQEEKEVVKKHIEELQLNFPTLLDETGEVAKSYNVITHPSHFLIDEEGKVRAVRPGFASREDLDFLAKILLEEKTQ